MRPAVTSDDDEPESFLLLRRDLLPYERGQLREVLDLLTGK
jgi:hypothetical protein